jgi:hypothetical protein
MRNCRPSSVFSLCSAGKSSVSAMIVVTLVLALLIGLVATDTGDER